MNPSVIKWARETAGLSLEEAAKALDLASSERLARIESGDEAPTRAQLLKMSSRYKRSLVVFYLPEPPRKGDRGRDFRTLSFAPPPLENALVDALLRDVKARQDLVRSILIDQDPALRVDFVGKYKSIRDVDSLRAEMTAVLGISLDKFRSYRTAEAAFAYLRERTETAGVFVLLKGDLGSHHTALSVEVFRGFASADAIAPFIVVNDQDAKVAWSFTLLHEIAHLMIGESGISSGLSDVSDERFCNEVASTFLLPRDELQLLPVNSATTIDEAIARISSFAEKRLISRRLVAYVLFSARKINAAHWRSLDSRLAEISQKERQLQKEKRKRDETMVDYYTVRRHRLGKALVELVRRTLSAGDITPAKAAHVLGVKPRGVTALLSDSSVGSVS